MALPRRPFIPDIVRQHAGDAAFLWQQRRREVAGHAFDARDLGRLDRRVEGHLLGLEAAGQGAIAALEEQAGEFSGTGEWFALASTLIRLGMTDGIAARLDDAFADARAVAGIRDALAHADAATIAPGVRDWIHRADPRLRMLALSALADHRSDPGTLLARLFEDADAEVRTQAIRLAGLVGRVDLASAIAPALDHAATADAAAGALLLLGHAQDEAEQHIGRRVARTAGDDGVGDLLDLCLLARPDNARDLLRRLLQATRPEAAALALSRTGLARDWSVTDWLIARMRDPATAEAAGFAFRDMIDIDVNDTETFTSDPETLGPGFVDLDPADLPVADEVAVFLDTHGRPPRGLPRFVSQRRRRLQALSTGLARPEAIVPRWDAAQPGPAWT